MIILDVQIDLLNRYADVYYRDIEIIALNPKFAPYKCMLDHLTVVGKTIVDNTITQMKDHANFPNDVEALRKSAIAQLSNITFRLHTTVDILYLQARTAYAFFLAEYTTLLTAQHDDISEFIAGMKRYSEQAMHAGIEINGDPEIVKGVVKLTESTIKRLKLDQVRELPPHAVGADGNSIRADDCVVLVSGDHDDYSTVADICVTDNTILLEDGEWHPAVDYNYAVVL